MRLEEMSEDSPFFTGRLSTDKPQVEASEEDAFVVLKSERNITNRIRAKFRGDPLGRTTQEQKRHWQLADDEPAQMIEEYVQRRLAARPAPTAEKTLREALELIRGISSATSGHSDTHIRCEVNRIACAALRSKEN